MEKHELQILEILASLDLADSRLEKTEKKLDEVIHLLNRLLRRSRAGSIKLLSVPSESESKNGDENES